MFASVQIYDIAESDFLHFRETVAAMAHGTPLTSTPATRYMMSEPEAPRPIVGPFQPPEAGASGSRRNHNAARVTDDGLFQLYELACCIGGTTAAP